jgi:hypothetical protein
MRDLALGESLNCLCVVCRVVVSNTGGAERLEEDKKG